MSSSARIPRSGHRPHAPRSTAHPGPIPAGIRTGPTARQRAERRRGAGHHEPVVRVRLAAIRPTRDIHERSSNCGLDSHPPVRLHLGSERKVAEQAAGPLRLRTHPQASSVRDGATKLRHLGFPPTQH
eukprot:1462532-Prymnesium_polylepis.1